MINFTCKYCKNVGIQLIVIKDLDSSKNFITETIDELVQLIKCGYSSIGRARASKPRWCEGSSPSIRAILVDKNIWSWCFGRQAA